MMVKIGRDQPLQIHKLLKWTHSTSKNFVVWNISSILDAFVFVFIINWVDGLSQYQYPRGVLSIQGVGHCCGVGAAETLQEQARVQRCLSKNCWGSSQDGLKPHIPTKHFMADKSHEEMLENLVGPAQPQPGTGVHRTAKRRGKKRPGSPHGNKSKDSTWALQPFWMHKIQMLFCTF